jgi:hypothetical protein
MRLNNASDDRHLWQPSLRCACSAYLVSHGLVVADLVWTDTCSWLLFTAEFDADSIVASSVADAQEIAISRLRGKGVL